VPDGSCPSAETVGKSTVSFAMYVTDVDAAYKKALAAGAKEDKPISDMFWGDRAGSVNDPFGITWWLLTHVRDVSPEELRKVAQATVNA
jgi:uncharacterized glyoxalase superfamily protein PhnB